MGFSCTNHSSFPQVKNGDLLFVGNSKGELSKAIDDVTQTSNQTNYSHLAMVEKSGNQYFVLHAAPENGSEKISLSQFIANEKKEGGEIDLYRIQKISKNGIKRAIKKAKEMLGKPYNFTYVMSDTAYYCSDFIYHAFEEDSIFTVNPMTFKNPESNEFNPTWVEFYKKLNMEIPEGKLGCNPNGMAASVNISKIGRL